MQYREEKTVEEPEEARDASAQQVSPPLYEDETPFNTRGMETAEEETPLPDDETPLDNWGRDDSPVEFGMVNDEHLVAQAQHEREARSMADNEGADRMHSRMLSDDRKLPMGTPPPATFHDEKRMSEPMKRSRYHVQNLCNTIFPHGLDKTSREAVEFRVMRELERSERVY